MPNSHEDTWDEIRADVVCIRNAELIDFYDSYAGE